MSKYKFFIVSKNNEFLLGKNDFDLGDDSQHAVDVELFSNEKNESLCRLYNTAIDKSKDNYDYIVFMHADVKLDIKGLVQHIESVAGKYDVIGLCGCDKMSVSSSPLNWFTGSKDYPNHRWGSVTHGEIGDQTSFFSKDRPDTDHEVACIDGLCIIFTKIAMQKLHFDERFSFSHYDTDISFQCVFNEKLKLGVIVRKDLHHTSIGKSILTPEFLKAEQLFRSKWSFAAA